MKFSILYLITCLALAGCADIEVPCAGLNMDKIILPDVEQRYIATNRIKMRVEKGQAFICKTKYSAKGEVLSSVTSTPFGTSSIYTYRPDGWQDTRYDYGCTSQFCNFLYYNDRQGRKLYQLGVYSEYKNFGNCIIYEYDESGRVIKRTRFKSDHATVYVYAKNQLKSIIEYSWQSSTSPTFPYGTVVEESRDDVYYNRGHLDSIISTGINIGPSVDIYNELGLLAKTKIYMDRNARSLKKFSRDSCAEMIKYSYYK